MGSKIVLKNCLIDYFVFNQAGEKCLLFLHGWRSQKEVWNGVIKNITSPNPSYDKEGNSSAYAIDLPGFGGSPMPKNPHPGPLPKGEGGMTVADYAEVVKEFIEKLELKNVIIVGHSFGGRVGIKLASKHPALVSKLILVDSAGFVTEQTKVRVMELSAKLVKPFFLPKFMQGLRRKIYKLIGADDYVATPWLTETFIKIKSEDLSGDMKKITCPTLIINGENDKDTPVEFGQRMQAIISNSIPSSDGMALSHDRVKFVILPNAGHFSFLDQPEEFVKALTDFI